MDETVRATRTMYQRIIRDLLVLLGALLALGLLAGYLVAGMPGVWGAVMAVGIAAFFMLTTVVTMLWTADKPLHIASAAFVGGWLVKIVALFAALLAVRDLDLHDDVVFFVVLVVAIAGSTAVEMRAVLGARVPNTGSGGPDAPRPPA